MKIQIESKWEIKIFLLMHAANSLAQTRQMACAEQYRINDYARKKQI